MVCPEHPKLCYHCHINAPKPNGLCRECNNESQRKHRKKVKAVQTAGLQAWLKQQTPKRSIEEIMDALNQEARENRRQLKPLDHTRSDAVRKLAPGTVCNLGKLITVTDRLVVFERSGASSQEGFPQTFRESYRLNDIDLGEVDIRVL